jgi:uncharacterized protein with PhoU and TrkA domain
MGTIGYMMIEHQSALKRGDTSTFNPGPDERIEAGDVLVALGPIHALDRIEKATQ